MSGVRPDLIRFMLDAKVLYDIKTKLKLEEFESKRVRSRSYTKDDQRAKNKRVAKWRAKKGYS